MSKNYEVSGGKVLRDGEPIANYDEQTGKLDFLPDKAKFRAPVVEFLRSMSLPVEGGKTAKKSGIPAEVETAPAVDSKPAQGDSEGSGDTVTVSKAEFEALKAKLAEMATAQKQADTVSKGIEKKIAFCPPGEKIFDPVVGHIRG